MLRSVQTNINCSCDYVRSKCAEIHFQTSDFSICCIFCGLTTKCYDNFLEHFRNYHIEDFDEQHSNQTPPHHHDPLELPDKENVDNPLYMEKLHIDHLKVREIIADTSADQVDITATGELATEHAVNDLSQMQSDFRNIKENIKFQQKSHTVDQTNSFLQTCKNEFDSEDMIIYPNKIDMLAVNERDSSKSSHTDNESVDWTKPYAPTLLKNKEKRPYKERNKSHICNYCGRNFRRRYQLDTHLNIHTGSKPFQCDICGRQFRAVTTLTRHLNTHEQREADQCRHCPKAFTHKAALLSHELRHTQQRSVSCDECDKLFYTVNQMDTHKRKVHHKADDDALAFACDLCAKRYRSASMLSTHKFKKHYKMAKYSCEKCGKKFIDDDKLQKHRPIHEDQLHNNLNAQNTL